MSVEPSRDAAARYVRQMALRQIGKPGQRAIEAGTVVIVGLGALGCVQASYLARAGVGRLRLVDRDVVEEGNLQRQVLFDHSDALEGRPKAEAALRHLRSIHPDCNIESRIAHLEPGNARELLGGSDVILDGTDNFETRFLINDFSLAAGIPWIYGACVGDVGSAAPMIPGRTACLRCWTAPQTGRIEPTCESAGILGPAAGIIGSFQAAAALGVLVEGEAWKPWGPLRVEAWEGQARSLASSRPDPECPACGHRKLEFLEGRAGAAQEVLCGRNAVQVLPRRRAPRDLLQAERALAGLGEIHRTEHLLRASLAGYSLSIFPDGRVIVFGLSDPNRARALVDRYLADF
jgi:adenylyltransferase/sulfurtransferase